jgi:hypothetical protein
MKSAMGQSLLRLAAMVLLALAPLACAAKEACPWMNDATAGGFLGGNVASVVTHPEGNKGDATCEFSLIGQGDLLSLRIEVQTMSDLSQYAGFRARCGADSESVRAVGNEAVACSAGTSKRQMTEQVVGRVRNRVFIVRIVARAEVLDPTLARDRAEKAAEQVAGILF